MATNEDNVQDTPFLRALDSILIQIQGLNAGKALLFDLLIAGQGNANSINAEILDLDRRINLKHKEISQLKLQAMVTTGPSAEQIEKLRASVAELERMNAIAQGLSGILDATLDIADAILYKPVPAVSGAREAAASARLTAPSPQSNNNLAMVAAVSALAGATFAALLLRRPSTKRNG